ncbi:Panacea domain-containing protein [Actinoplanes awajinensis]|uniref:Antitoxin SocA-like Panacea domain-containing protein n=1 Tax=Actinoplanes awajinensis subsp. mycoplanecinus TaxID=135947 RepID=A0A0X3V3C9_9ACTN|nr:type II toxin-antitoxin system antitoxin SocA domain-containing protein [Actinoplanes awajinensis]KUL39295.1 hypothetical protein ADL15_10030 [Actinoplanes awajinensis subsp. mycoplanecinus]
MTVAAYDVAVVLRERLPGLPVLKLHKLLYYVQAHYLAATGDPMFDEAISAWDMGPVVGSLWNAERNGDLPVVVRPLSDGQLNCVDYVVTRYGGLSGVDLMHLAHAEDPWRDADRDRPRGGSVRISNVAMRDYFRSDDVHDEGEVWFTLAKVVELTAGADLGPAAGEPLRDETALLQAQLADLQAQLSA